MANDEFDRLIGLIKEKNELKGISSEVVRDTLNLYLLKNNIDLGKLSQKDKEVIKKDIRAELRKYVGRFHLIHKGEVEKMQEEDFLEIITKHSSTRERLESYELLKSFIEEIAPRKIIDLGCGLNPLMIAKKGMEYYAVDINKSDLEIVGRYFSLKKIEGHIINKDIRKITEINLPAADLCLILKVFDVIESRGHRLAETVLDEVNTKKLIISFPTKTLSGRPMNHPQRGWIERLLARKGWPFELHKSKNEIFYIVKKLKE